MRRVCLIHIALTFIFMATSLPTWARRQDSPVNSPSSKQKTATYSPTMAGRSARNLLRNGRDYLSYRKYERALELLREAQDKQVELDSSERALLKQSITAAQRGLREDDGSRTDGKNIAQSSKNVVKNRSIRSRSGGFIAASPLLETDDVKSPIADQDDAVRRTRINDEDPADFQPKPAPSRPKVKTSSKVKPTLKSDRSSDLVEDAPNDLGKDSQSILNPREVARPIVSENTLNNRNNSKSTTHSNLIQNSPNGDDSTPLIINDDDVKTDADVPPPIHAVPAGNHELPLPPSVGSSALNTDESTQSHLPQTSSSQPLKNVKSRSVVEDRSPIVIGDSPLIINDDEPLAPINSSNSSVENASKPSSHFTPDDSSRNVPNLPDTDRLKDRSISDSTPKLENLPPLNVQVDHDKPANEGSGSTFVIQPLPVPAVTPNLNSANGNGSSQEPVSVKSSISSPSDSTSESKSSPTDSALDLPPLPGESDRLNSSPTRIADDRPERINSSTGSAGTLNRDDPIEPAREVNTVLPQTPRSEFISMPDPDSYIPKRGLSEESKREVERIAQAQERKSRSVPTIDLSRDEAAPGDTTTSGIVLPRAPSPTEARAIRPIPVPEEFVPMGPRDWTPSRKAWSAAATCHLPLYFQDASLERYGHSAEQFFGPAGRYMSYPLDDPKESNQRSQILQPFMSFGLFITQIAALPYNVIMDPPWEAEYDLGYYRPGDRVPTDVYYLPVTGVGPPLRGANYGR